MGNGSPLMKRSIMEEGGKWLVWAVSLYRMACAWQLKCRTVLPFQTPDEACFVDEGMMVVLCEVECVR